MHPEIMLPLASRIARKLSAAQREALLALAEGRAYPIGVVTMGSLVRWDLVTEVQGAPKPTQLGLEVVEKPPGRGVALGGDRS